MIWLTPSRHPQLACDKAAILARTIEISGSFELMGNPRFQHLGNRRKQVVRGHRSLEKLYRIAGKINLVRRSFADHQDGETGHANMQFGDERRQVRCRNADCLRPPGQDFRQIAIVPPGPGPRPHRLPAGRQHTSAPVWPFEPTHAEGLHPPKELLSSTPMYCTAPISQCIPKII